MIWENLSRLKDLLDIYPPGTPLFMVALSRLESRKLPNLMQ